MYRQPQMASQMLRQMDLMHSLSAQNAISDLASLRDHVAGTAYAMGTSREVLLGEERLDSQHQILFGLTRDLESAALLRSPVPILIDCFERFVLYIAVHFATEERLMSEG